MKITVRSIAALLAFAGLSACGFSGQPGESDKIGQIVSVHRIGVFCKTWEASIMRGGFQNGSGVNGAAFNFTIESDSLAKAVEHYMETNTEVKIRYRSEGVYAACRTESGGDFLVSIAPVNASATK